MTTFAEKEKKAFEKVVAIEKVKVCFFVDDLIVIKLLVKRKSVKICSS